MSIRTRKTRDAVVASGHGNSCRAQVSRYDAVADLLCDLRGLTQTFLVGNGSYLRMFPGERLC